MEEINMIKKSTIIKLAASAGLMTSFALTTQYSNINVFTPQTVQASSKFRVKLTHNAYIYNYRGKRRGRKVLKKGRKYTAYRTKRIHHKKYYYLGHHNYIKAGNAKKFEEKKASKYLFSVKLNLGAEIDVKPAGQISQWDMYGTVKVYQVQKVNNQTWYKLGRDRWVKASETNKNPDSTAVLNNNKTYSVTSSKDTSKTKTVTKADISSRGIRKLNITEENEIKEKFLQKVNSWRAQQGLKPFKTTSLTNQGAQIRANEGATLFPKLMDTQHIRPNGQSFWTAFSNSDQILKEVAAWAEYQDDSTDDMAQSAFDTFVYNDAGSNWGHREALRSNYDKPLIGIGVSSVIVDGEPYMILYGDIGKE